MDHEDFSRRLLTDTLCIVGEAAPPLRDGFTLQQNSSQTEVSSHMVLMSSQDLYLV
jgi:hypothetical protein